MRTQEEIRTELASAKEAYDKVALGAESEWRPYSNQIKALQKELSDCISEGAKPCPHCGGQPIGLRHVHLAPFGANQSVEFFIYEIGCPCKDSLEMSMSPDRETAVAMWNRDEWNPPLHREEAHRLRQEALKEKAKAILGK